MNADGFCDVPYYIAGNADYLPWNRQDGWLIQATVEVKPSALNRNSRSGLNAVTAYIEMPGHEIGQIDIGTLKLSTSLGGVSAQSFPLQFGDFDGDGIPDLMVKFDRQKIIDIVDGTGEVEIVITGKINGNKFRGSDRIRVIK